MRWRQRLAHLWDVRPNEGLRTFLLFANVFLVIAAYTITKTVRDSLFLVRFGLTELSYTMIGIAAVAGVAVSVLTRLSARLPRNRLIWCTNGFIASTLVLLALGFSAGHHWLAWVLYFWSGVFGLFLVAESWLLGNDLFNAREAKRLFPLVGAGAIVGGVVGGLLSSWLAKPLGTANLLYLVAAQLLLSAAISDWAFRRRHADLPNPPLASRVTPRFAEGLALIRKAPYLRLVALMMVCMTVCMTIVQWQYKGIAKAHFGSDRDAMTAFFGLWAAILNIASFALQALVTPVLLRRFGVGFGLRVLPVGFIFGALILLGNPLLPIDPLGTAVAAVMLSDGFRFSIDKASMELLYLPIPRAVKDQAKPFIDTVVDRFAGAIAAFAWLFLTWTFHIDQPGHIAQASLLTLVIAIAWLVVIARARKAHVHAYRQMIGGEAHPQHSTRPNVAECERLLSNISKASSPNRTRLVKQLGRLCRHESLRLRPEQLPPFISKEVDLLVLLGRALDAEGLVWQGEPEMSAPLLGRTLAEKITEAMERSARLLSLAYDPGDIRAVFMAIRDPSPTMRAGALELLDNLLLRGRAKARFIRVLEQIVLPSKRPRPERTKTLALLLTVDDWWLRACAAWTARRAGLLSDDLAHMAIYDPAAPVREAAWPPAPSDREITSLGAQC